MRRVSVGFVSLLFVAFFALNAEANRTVINEFANDLRNENQVPKTYDGLTIDQWRERMKNLGPGVPGSVQAVIGLTELAGDRSAPPLVRQQAALMLGRIGRPSVSAIPTLQKLLSEPDKDTESPALWGAKALSLLGPLAKDSAPLICATLRAKDSAWATRLACIEALSRIGGLHPKTIPTLIDLLKNSLEHETPAHQLELRQAAADALMLIGPTASFAVPTLMDFVDHEDQLLRTKAVGALGAMGSLAVPAASVVAERLVFDDAAEVRKSAALALGKFGPEVNDMLLVLTEDEEEEVRQLTLLAIAQQSKLDPKIEEAIAESLQDSIEAVQLEAVKTSVHHQILRSQSVKQGIELLFSKDRKISVEAANLLEQIKPDRAEIEAAIDREQLESNARARGLIQRLLRNLSESQP